MHSLTVRDAYNLHRGYREAKDTNDDLTAEIRKRIAKGYPLANIPPRKLAARSCAN